MKRTLLAILLLFTLNSAANAQTFREWFRQKKTQKKYLIQQIAANQVYLEYLNKGYEIAKDGLGMIGSFKRGEFNLHGDYFNSLKNVNPEIKHYAKVVDIIALQVRIVQGTSSSLRQFNRSDAFSSDELGYVQRVFGRLLEDCGTSLDELLAVTTDGELEMKDDERIARIDQIYLAMLDKHTFFQNFSNETQMMAVVRLQENKDVNTSRALQGVKNQ